MKTLDLMSSLFWLVFSLIVIIESLRLGIGTLHNPGMGFMVFGASGILGLLSLFVFLQAVLEKRSLGTERLFAGSLWKRIVYVLIVLLIYARLMPVAGYLISTFFLMSFLFWIVKGQKWWGVLISSLLATLSTYYIFSVWLNGQFPTGFLGF